MDTNSGFKLFSVGTTAEDVKPDKLYIEIHLLEKIPVHTGEINEKVEKGSSSFTLNPLDGVMYGTTVKDTKVKARWYSKGSERITPPNLKKGSTVLVYKMDGTDRYVWEPYAYEKDIHDLSTVVHAYPNIKRDESTHGDILSKKTTYYTKISTKEKKIQLVTSMSDKEPVAYTFEINTKKGVFSILDTKKNLIKLDSVNGKLTINVPHIEFNGKTFAMNMKNWIKEKTAKTIIGGGNFIVDHVSKFNKVATHTSRLIAKQGVKLNKGTKTVKNSDPVK